ncbi:MAG: extracellular solute-binding protein [Globicatella sulfidifaciens]|uniref:Extracellular solute-binding protein n=2 Tax=Globicatella sulfidifaciens TaxID=136093 RepID=A0A7X8H136_9LACT|nr:extracellular solute-binding protein [Globicatella sulfidifaciens]
MTKKMKLTYIIAALLLIVFTVILILGRENMRKPSDELLSQADYERSMAAIESYISGFQSAENYYTIAKGWAEDGVLTPSQTYIIDAESRTGGQVYDQTRSQDYHDQVTYLEPGDELTFSVDVEEAGLYELWLDYYILEETYLEPELSVQVNEQAQYNEMNRVTLFMEWEPENVDGEIQYDRYGDQLPPRSILKSKWESRALFDPNHFFTTPLKFNLDQGENTITITLNEGYLLMGEIMIGNEEENIPSYEEYFASLSDQQSPVENKMITIEAENVATKSRQSIRPQYVRDPAVTPYEYRTRVLNVLDGNSFADPGDHVKYNFYVEESGFYNLTLKYFQNTNNGMPTRRRIEIDGEVPFQELELYLFEYTSRWKNETLQDDNGEDFYIYLSEGEHTLTLSIDNSDVADVYHELLTMLEAIDSLGREITQLTGGLVDRNRDWRIEQYMPEISTYLYAIIERIDEQKEVLIDIIGDDSLPAITEIEIAIDMLKDFYEDPDDIPHYMQRFNQGHASAYGRIQSILPSLVHNPMSLDKFYFHATDANLEHANASIFNRMLEGIKAFGYSFFNPRYNEVDQVDDDTIEIWVNQSRLYVEIMQRMIDEAFTPNTGIKVNLSLLPDEQRIVLSNAADSVPDGALGVSHNMPFELGLRGIIEDLSQYDGFYDLAKQFNPNTFTQVIYDEGVYGIPETQDVKLLFYRKDMLDFIGEEPPETWEEVVSLIPMLQRYDMNVFVPLGADSAFKGFDTTTPFIYQFGGRLFNETGNQTAIHQEGAYEAFDFMTSLFTVYNMPITTSEFYQSFRDGKSPVGIGDANLYIQLRHAAPELAGQWGLTTIPGVENEQGVIERWDPTYGSNAIIFSDSPKKEKTWEFIRWWTSADTQAKFSYDIQSTLGNQFLYLTANIEGFKVSAWPNDSKQVILDQWDWIQTTGRVPGDYIIERELSNAWNRVVLDGANPRIAIDQAVRIIDRELERKLREFGYIEDGQLVRPYLVPTIDNIERWMTEDGQEH